MNTHSSLRTVALEERVPDQSWRPCGSAYNQGQVFPAHIWVAKAYEDCPAWLREGPGPITCNVSHLWHLELLCAVISPNQQSHLSWHLLEARCHMLITNDIVTETRPEKWCQVQSTRFICLLFLCAHRNIFSSTPGFWVMSWGQKLQGQKSRVGWEVKEGGRDT